ncbi:hypothetical protein HKX48_003336 [Thoreauomyces humboldtii]|nr:hypothetical protein HKX48_003336 [Thoreauomyces humboldtii]
MKSEHNCPPGIYLRPAPDNLYAWHGTLFLHRGFYKEGVFQFVIRIPPSYPSCDTPPTVQFTTDMFHPLVARDGSFNLTAQFPVWRARRDYIAHVLHYMKNAFKEAVLDGLEEEACSNRDAYRIFHDERPLFAKLAAQCAQLSVSEAILFDDADASAVRFSPLADDHFDEIKAQMIASLSPQTTS